MSRQKFIILTSGRSGSTYLQHLLNSHPTITCHDEIFNVANKSDLSFYSFCRKHYPKLSYFFLRGKISKSILNFPLKFLVQEYFKMIYEKGDDCTIGFKLIYDQLLYYHPLASWIQESSVSVIHLQRRNPLKAAISLIKARNNGVYTLTSAESQDRQKIKIELHRLLHVLRSSLEEKSKCEAIIQNNPALIIYYEDLFEEQSSTVQQIGTFLSIKNLSFEKPDIIKTNPNAISDILENYSEVSEALKGTVWEKYID